MSITLNGTPQAAWLSELKKKHPDAFPQEPVKPTPPDYPQAEYDAWKPLNDKLLANPDLANDEAFMAEYTPIDEAWKAASAVHDPLAVQYHKDIDVYNQQMSDLEAAHQANTDIRYMPSYMQGYQEMLANAGLAGGPEKPNLKDYQGHPWMQMYDDIVNPFDTKAPNLKDLDYYARNFGIDTSVANLQSKFNSLTQQEYAQKNKEFQRSEDQYYQNMSAQNAQYQQGVQNAMSQALASGSSRGMQFANQFAAQNELAQQNSSGALELAQQRNDLKAEEAQAYAQNAIDAERTAYDRKANILNQAVTDRASEVQRYAADASVYAQELASRLQNYQYNIGLEYARHEADTQRAHDLYTTHLNNRLEHYGKNTENKRERDKSYIENLIEYARLFGQADVAHISADAQKYSADVQKYVADKNFETNKYSVDNTPRSGGGGGYYSTGGSGGYRSSGGGGYYSSGSGNSNPGASDDLTFENSKDLLQYYYSLPAGHDREFFLSQNPSMESVVTSHYNYLSDVKAVSGANPKKVYSYTGADGKKYYAQDGKTGLTADKVKGEKKATNIEQTTNYTRQYDNNGNKKKK